MFKKDQYNKLKVGMDTDTHPSELNPTSYTFALNAIVQSQAGDGIIQVQNEPSNLLNSTLSIGDYIIGNKYDAIKSRIYLFVTNPTTNVSSIGYIKLGAEYIEEDIEFFDECTTVEKIVGKLEDIVQRPFSEYVTMVEDSCNKCLGFDINSPFRDGSIVLKTEKCGQVLYFSNVNAPTRRLETDNLDKYKIEGHNICQDIGEKPVCLNCHKLLLRPTHSTPIIKPHIISNGGQLKMGVYEYAIAGCDKFGNEATPYYSATTGVQIHSNSSKALTLQDYELPTNFGILLSVYWDDPNIRWYKVVVSQTSGMGGTVSHYVEGIYSISVKEVSHNTDRDKMPISLNKIKIIPPVYKTARLLTESNGYLFEGGLTVEKHINLQPITLLMGAFALWQTVEASEELYSDGIATSLYKTTLRDEVYPYAIRFLTNNGGITPAYVLASRPSRTRDLDIIDNKNTKSIRSIKDDCVLDTRMYRYQFENTAKVLTNYKHIDTDIVNIGGSTIELDSKCTVKPHEVGEFAYWESMDTYPDNKQLFDASNLIISVDDLPNSKYVQDNFTSFFTTGEMNGKNFKLSNNTDFRCKPIRHYRYPDFNTSPFMSTDNINGFQPSKIYPIGLFLEDEVVVAFLKIAVKNGLITEEQYNSIEGFEILIGDRSLHKSIIAKGLIYDTYKYKDTKGKEVLYSNYPYNDLRKDQLHLDRRGGSDIQHPFNGKGNNRFTFHSPDTHFYTPVLPNEMVIEGFQSGLSRGTFAQVDGHAKYVILGSKAYTYAKSLAVGEAVFEAVALAGEFTMNLAELSPTIATPSFTGTQIGAWAGMASGTFTGTFIGLPSTTTKTGSVAAIVVLSTLLALAGSKVGSVYSKAKTQWLDTFKKFGNPVNFAYFYTSNGYYNKGHKNPGVGGNASDSYLRRLVKREYLGSGKYTFTEDNNKDFIRVNNLHRESSVFLSTGAFNVDYPSSISSIDKSRYIAGEQGMTNVNGDEEIETGIASPYVSLKRYSPRQYSDVGSIRWLPTGYSAKLNRGLFHRIFGGDTFISRMSLKRKVPMFTVTAIGVADRTPFRYDLYQNIGINKYWCNFDVTDIELDNGGFPTGILDLIGAVKDTPVAVVNSVYNFDTLTEAGNYVRDNSKFYLYYYGIPQFLVESDINCNLRLNGVPYAERFYPSVGDYVDWTQEKNVTIKEDNFYKYNEMYSRNPQLSNASLLPVEFDREISDCMMDMPSGVIYSMQDTSEQDLVDPWSVFRPLDFYQFPTSYGKLIRLVGIESTQVVGLFENQLVLYNAIDELKDRTTQQMYELGTGGIFARRPLDFFKSDLGFSGTQHSAFISTETGHYYTDMKRGHIMRIAPNGKGLEAIDGGKRQWLMKHLPFKLLKQGISGLTDLDVDNNYIGIGVTLGWDSKEKRLLVTKLDYIVNDRYKNKLSYKNYRFYLGDEEVLLSDTKVFTECSFTISYSAIQDSWTSYHSYTPNFYINDVESFTTAYNLNNRNGIGVTSLWEHGKTEQSFGVFQGKPYPFEVEFVTQNTMTNNELSSIEYWLDSRRYKDKVNYATVINEGFEEVHVYNDTETTGIMKLVPEDRNNRRQQILLPRLVNNVLNIIVNIRDKKWNFNTLNNRIKKDGVNVSQIIKDVNEIYKIPNEKVLDTSGIMKDKLRGNWFKVHLKRYKTTHKIIVQWVKNTIQI